MLIASGERKSFSCDGEKFSRASLVSSSPSSRQHAKIESGKSSQVELTHNNREKSRLRVHLFIASELSSSTREVKLRCRINYLRRARTRGELLLNRAFYIVKNLNQQQ